MGRESEEMGRRKKTGKGKRRWGWETVLRSRLRITLEILKKFSSNTSNVHHKKKHNDTHCAIAMTTVMPLVLF